MTDPDPEKAATETVVGLAREARKRERLRRFDLDVRGVIALMALMGTFGLAFTLVVTKGTAEVPQWAATLLGGVVGYYFGTRSTSGGNGSSES